MSRRMMRPALIVTAAAVLSLAGLGGCPVGANTLPTGVTGTAAAGESTFMDRCAACHSAAGLRSVSGRITNNMGNVAGAMRGITLSDQEVADLRAFLATQ
jgi:mono/diheme cytochrome c family protein